MKKIKYLCNLCAKEILPVDNRINYPVWFEHHTFRLGRITDNCETHLCYNCLESAAHIFQEVKKEKMSKFSDPGYRPFGGVKNDPDGNGNYQWPLS